MLAAGVLGVSPSEGTALVTMFEMIALYWDSANLPLTYEFRYSVFRDHTYLLHSRSYGSTYITVLPDSSTTSSGEIRIILVVYDYLEAKSRIDRNVTVAPTTLTIDDAYDEGD